MAGLLRLRHLAHCPHRCQLDALYDTIQTVNNPMIDFDERDLLRLVTMAGSTKCTWSCVLTSNEDNPTWERFWPLQQSTGAEIVIDSEDESSALDAPSVDGESASIGWRGALIRRSKHAGQGCEAHRRLESEMTVESP